MLRRPHNKEGPPVFSHEFVIQNHADIVSCICMVVFVGLIPQFSNQLASSVIFVQYNKTVEPESASNDIHSTRLDNKPLPVTYYQHGLLDLLNVVFYALVWIIIHALLQEYIWERTGKRLHLSKVKLSKYYDSGCLVVFFFLSLVWGVNYIIQENFLWEWQQLYLGYPHHLMKLSLKFYMLTQMGFWLHCYPELYFMKMKKLNLYSKIVLYTSSLLMISGAYFVKLQRLALILLVLHYSVEFLFHACKLLHYHNKDHIAGPGFKLWKLLFVVVRVLTVIIAVLTLWFGLGKVHEQLKMNPPPAADIGSDEADGDVNATAAGVDDIPLRYPVDLTEPVYRLCGLGFVVVLQLWVGWTFLSKLMQKSDSSSSSTEGKPIQQKTNKRRSQTEVKSRSPKVKSS